MDRLLDLVEQVAPTFIQLYILQGVISIIFFVIIACITIGMFISISKRMGGRRNGKKRF